MTVRGLHRALAGAAVVVAALVLNHAAEAHASGRAGAAAHAKPCPILSQDAVCARRGTVSFAEYLGTPSRLFGQRPRRIGQGTLIRTELGALGSVSFSRSGTCLVGGSSAPGPSEIITRVGRYVFEQRRGYTKCTFARRRVATTGFLCQADGACPALFRSNGSVVFHAFSASGARSAQESETVRITVCSRAWRARVEGPNGGEIGGYSSSGGRVEIVFRRTATTVELTGERKKTEGICADPGLDRQQRDFDAEVR